MLLVNSVFFSILLFSILIAYMKFQSANSICLLFCIALPYASLQYEPNPFPTEVTVKLLNVFF